VKRTWKTTAVVLVLIALAGFGFAGLGFVPVDARGGHLPITNWFLHFTMRRAVKLQARGIDVPPNLGDALMQRRGAGIYAVGCASCHGAPGQPQALAGTLMTPPAPALTRELVGKWNAAELFWIVQNGIKYTAMPGWSALHREDEIWPVVAFLLALPHLDVRSYRALAYGDDSDAQVTAPAMDLMAVAGDTCFQCHGADGRGRDGTAPTLAGQSAVYLAESLQAYALGRRYSGVMQPLSAALQASDVYRYAEHFAALPAAAATTPVDALLARRGATIARDGVAARDIPPCASCHASGDGARAPAFPRLDGQDVDYLTTQLRLFRASARGGTAAAALMDAAVRGLTDEELRAVAHYYAARGREDLQP
jgi:cytochrome c553